MTASPRALGESRATLPSAIEHALDEADEREFWRAVRDEHTHTLG